MNEGQQPLTACVLIYCDEESLQLGTLTLDSIRVGFPTAQLRIYHNLANRPSREVIRAVREKVERILGNVTYIPMEAGEEHHAWIKHVINSAHGRLAILDGDLIFWKSCEHFYSRKGLMGFYIPQMLNEYSQCLSIAKLHTSFLWIQDVSFLKHRIQDSLKHNTNNKFTKVKLYESQVIYIGGDPVYYDTCAMLYNVVGGDSFADTHLDCYDHVNCVTYYKEMLGLVENKEAFEKVHELALRDPSALKGYWRELQAYYNHQAAKVRTL